MGGKLTAERWLEVERDILEFQQVICEILDERRANPQDDLLSTLVSTKLVTALVSLGSLFVISFVAC